MAASYRGAALPSRHRSPEALPEAVQGCRGCPLYADATQAVFGAGPPNERLVLVDGQPGDDEDRAGQRSVGPAGGVLDRTRVGGDRPERDARGEHCEARQVEGRKAVAGR
jgi:uracil-DNA glycosylase